MKFYKGLINRRNFVCSYESISSSTIVVKRPGLLPKNEYKNTPENEAMLEEQMRKQVSQNPDFIKQEEERMENKAAVRNAFGFFTFFAFATVIPQAWPIPCAIALIPILTQLSIFRSSGRIKDYQRFVKYLETEDLFNNEFNMQAAIDGLSDRGKEILLRDITLGISLEFFNKCCKTWTLEKPNMSVIGKLSIKDFYKFLGNLEHMVAASHGYRMGIEESGGKQLTIGEKKEDNR